jgi:hypothetical protein
MKEYNRLITRFRGAEKYFADSEIHMEEKEIHIPSLRSLVNELDSVINKIADMGYTMTDEEIDKGFRQIEVLYPTKEA